MGMNHWKMEIIDRDQSKCTIEFWDQGNYWGPPCDYAPIGPFKWRNNTLGSMNIPYVDVLRSSPTMNGDAHGYDVFGGFLGQKFGNGSAASINVKFFVPIKVGRDFIPIVIFECFDLHTTNIFGLIRDNGDGIIANQAAARMKGGSMSWKLVPTGINN